MLFDTVAFNTVGGVNNTGGTVRPQNSLFASNTGFDYQGTLSSQGNNLFQITPASGTVATDLVEARPRFVKGAKYIRNAGLSPSGARARERCPCSPPSACAGAPTRSMRAP